MEQDEKRPGLQEQIDALTEGARISREDIDELRSRADASHDRADAAERRADAADARADLGDVRADAADVRMDKIEAAADLDREMIEELNRMDVLRREHAAQMEQALRSSRTIGAAVGFLMGSRGVDQDEAFAILKAASSHSNRKIRDMAEEIVSQGRADI